ncbi:MAG: hypothetical protein R3E76_09820 [Planctomycetota bacterium]
MRILLCIATLMLLAGCGEAVHSVENPPTPAPNEQPRQPAPADTTPAPAPSDKKPDTRRVPRPAPSEPGHGSIHWVERDGHSVAEITESDHVAELPEDVWGVEVRVIRWGCWGQSYRIDANSFERLTDYKQLKMLSLAGCVGDAEFACLGNMPALETLELFAFYELNTSRLEQVAKIRTLKKLVLHVSDDKATKAAVAEFKKSRPDVVIEQ